MRFYQLKEDKLPSKLPVRFSFQINSTIKSICDYNKNNIVGIREWSDYLNGVKSYVSYSVIAWDSTNRHIEFPNGAKFIKDFGYNVGYKILEDRAKQYSFVYIFMVNLNIEEFGLQYPSKITEKKQSNTMNNTKKRVRLTESQLHRLIKEAINELDWKTYANAGKKARYYGDISTQREINPNGTPYEWWKAASASRARAERFYKKAKEEFNATHGYEDGDMYGDNDTATTVEFGGDFGFGEEFAPHARGYRNAGSFYPRRQYDRGYESYAGSKTPEEFFGNDEAAKAYRNADDEIWNYRKGNYEYEKGGRGWHLKDDLDESIRRAIRKVLC